jgi:hypothetical protein
MKKGFLLVIIGLSLSFQFVNAQQVNRIQRGQRGYVPPPVDNTTTYVELKDPYKEVNIMLPKCVDTFNLDDFEKEIIKGILLKNFENQNFILGDEGNSRDERKKKLIELDKSFYKELALILSVDEIEKFKLMDFSETKAEKKQKKRKKRNKGKS